MKKYITLLLILLIPFALAHGEETFVEAESIIDAKIDCDQLTDEQLEVIGDYYMEQMHPGESHETMDEMMGGEGSESLKNMHINMARSFYCGEHGMMDSGMMDMMMGRNNMMNIEDNGGVNMMWPFGFGMGFGMFGFFFMIIFWGLIIWLVIWIITRATKSQKQSPLDILKKRYAKGEINKKIFEKMKKELR